jgi:hypothetical protein
LYLIRHADYVCINVIMRRVRANHCCSGKAVRITYHECVFVALGIRYAMRHVACHLWPAPLYHIFFPTLSQKLHDFREKVTEHKMYGLLSSTTFV